MQRYMSVFGLTLMSLYATFLKASSETSDFLPRNEGSMTRINSGGGGILASCPSAARMDKIWSSQTLSATSSSNCPRSVGSSGTMSKHFSASLASTVSVACDTIEVGIY